MGSFMVQSNEQNQISGHQAADNAIAANDVAENMPHESISEEDTKMEDLANGQNGQLTSESHSNGELDGKVVLPDESNSQETKMEE